MSPVKRTNWLSGICPHTHRLPYRHTHTDTPTHTHTLSGISIDPGGWIHGETKRTIKDHGNAPENKPGGWWGLVDP